MSNAIQLCSVIMSAGKNAEAVLKTLKHQGYDGVEVARRFGNLFGHSPVEFKRLLDDNGLKCTGCTTSNSDLEGEHIHQLAEEYSILGGKYLFCADLIVNQDEITDESAWKKAAERFNSYAEILKGYNMHIGVHNHNLEFTRLADGSTGWDVFYDNTTEAVLQELDTCHCIEGGGDPVYYINKYKNRSPVVHIKEFPRNQESNTGRLFPDPIAKGKFLVPFGSGTTDWDSVFEACKEANAEWYILECFMGVQGYFFADRPENDMLVSKEMLDFIKKYQ